MNKIEIIETSDKRQVIFRIPSDNEFAPIVSQTLPIDIALELQNNQQIVNHICKFIDIYLQRAEKAREIGDIATYRIYIREMQDLEKILELQDLVKVYDYEL